VKHGDYGVESRNRNESKETKLLIALMALCLAIGMWVSTQYVASSLDYHASLGGFILDLGNKKIYAPYKYWNWMVQLINGYGYDNESVQQYLLAGILVQLFALFFPAGVIRAQQKGRKSRAMVEKIQGSARWADKEDIIDSSLLPRQGGASEGVYVGAWHDKKQRKTLYLRHNGLEHILAYAPTRSGKGVGLVLPTLLSWPQSALVLDIKGENYALTAGWRKSGANNNILKFDPLDVSGNCARYNPLNEIRIGTTNEHADIENLAILLADPDGTASHGNQKHWVETSGSLIVALLYHMLYKGKIEGFEPTLERMRFMFADAERSFIETLEEIIVYDHDPHYKMGWTDVNGKPTKRHPIAVSNAMEAKQRDEREAASVLSTAANTTKLFVDPAIAFNTSNATFTLKDLANAEKPTTLYVCIPPAQITRLVPLVRILVTQIVTILASELEYENGKAVSKNKHRLLLMLDEFPTLGNMEIFETALAFIAGYGLKAYIIVQDLAQLYKRYTERESIVSNTHVQVAYAPNKLETAKVISEILGQTTVITEVQSKSVSKGVATYSVSEQEKQRALLTPDEVMGLKGPLKNKDGLIEEPGDMIIKVSGFPPIRGRQILYFKDPTFLARAQMPAPVISDVLFKDYSEKKEETANINNANTRENVEDENVIKHETQEMNNNDIPESINATVPVIQDTGYDERVAFAMSLKNPYLEEGETIELLDQDDYNDDELFEGNEDETFTGDEPDEEVKVINKDFDMMISKNSFFSGFIESETANVEYFQEAETF
jgi:type IV secretion system protein VirD4